MTVAIIQARTSSKRLPNKVMKKVNNQPLISYVYNRVKKSKKITKIVIACSKLRSDDQLVKFCKLKKYNFYRGSLNNVLERYVRVSKRHNLKYFVRITGDSPCIDPFIIDKAIQIFKTKKCDLVTNVHPRSYPIGISVEVINSKIIIDIEKNKNISKKNKEHLTSYFYKNKKEYKIINFKNKKNYSKYNLAIDRLSHLKKIKPVLQHEKFLTFTWKKILKLVY
jgi:spore coat polysaccharide biosynthesis protein SpsF (cytidylyltransferase family)